MNETKIPQLIDQICDLAENQLQQGELDLDLEAFARQELIKYGTSLTVEELESARKILVKELKLLLNDFAKNNSLFDSQLQTRKLDSSRCPQCGHFQDPQASPNGTIEANGSACSECGFQLGQSDPESTLYIDRTLQENPIINHRFKVTRKLGEGGFGIVYLAWDRELERGVALKLPRIKQNAPELLLREARAASRLRHPHIVRIYDVGTTLNDLTYIVSDYINGDTLARWMSDRILSPTAACEMLLPICRAIEHAHQNQIIHRDLKPGNIMVDHSDAPHVLDFGLSLSKANLLESIATRGRAIGTPAYMSPEQARGATDEIGNWTDVYGLGVIFYQLLTGHLPFAGKSNQILQEILDQKPLPPRKLRPKIPRSLESIVLKCLAKDVTQRYQSVTQLIQDIESFQRSESVSVGSPWEYRVLKKMCLRYSPIVLAVMCAALLLGVLAHRQYQSSIANPWTSFTIESNASTLTWIPLSQETIDWDWQQQTVLETDRTHRLPPGLYKVIAQGKNQYHEVFRTIPTKQGKPLQQSVSLSYLGIGNLPHRSWEWNGSIAELPPIHFVPDDKDTVPMVFIEGGKLEFDQDLMVPAEIRGKTFTVPSFLIDQETVDWAQFMEVFPDFQTNQAFSGDQPVHSVTWEVAVAFAEASGKQLPDIIELAFAATNRGKTLFPWGNHPLPNEDLKDRDKTQSFPPVLSMISGPAVWTETPVKPLTIEPLFEGMETVYLEGDPNKRLVFGLSQTDRDRQQQILQHQGIHFFRQDLAESATYIGLRLIRRLPR